MRSFYGKLALTGACLAVVAACGSRHRTNVVVTPAPATTPVGGVVASGVVGGGVASGGATTCQNQIEVGVVHTRAGCQIDERVSAQRTILTHSCGDGPASAAFADAVFEGGVSGGQLDISIETVFQFTDGCTWRTKQRISGFMSGGALSYHYEEQPDPGQRGCARGCLADAQVQVY